MPGLRNSGTPRSESNPATPCDEAAGLPPGGACGRLARMKQLTIANDIAADAEVRRLLSELGIEAWTRIPRCAGKGPRTGAREDDHVWPGYNAVTLAVVDDALAARALDALRAFRDAHPKSGLAAWTTPVDAAAI